MNRKMKKLRWLRCFVGVVGRLGEIYGVYKKKDLVRFFQQRGCLQNQPASSNHDQ